ncbi:hypothetical protein G6F57_019187 [Rhizopus arrhizus]|nr:hypothetical protein G6F57_019187 [Rhizopus arrhizus]
MAHRAGIELGAQPRVVRAALHLEAEIVGRDQRVAGAVDDSGSLVRQARHISIRSARVGAHRQAVADVVLHPQQRRLAIRLPPSPGLRRIAAAIGGARHVDAGGNQERTRRRVDFFVLGQQVQRCAQALALIVQRQGADVGA